MARYALALVFAFVLAATVSRAGGDGKEKAKFKDVKIDGAIEKDDPKDPVRNMPCKVHVVPLKAGQRYVIDMAGRGFDAFLRLEDPAGKELAEDDDSGGNLDAQIVYNCAKDGDFRVICTTFNGGVGKYTLSVKAAGAVKIAAGQASLIGMPAPDFAADFALNGKPARLSDLKGKVVLLNFWAVQSSPGAWPRLRDWHKAHKDAGLAVVGVTYFNSELGQKLGFDEAEGRLTSTDAASVATDQALLKGYAAHHKLDHLLLAMHKDKALNAFNEYLVNGLPQLVLIDRQGVIRFVCVGEDQVRNPDVDAEIKKVLAEKK